MEWIGKYKWIGLRVTCLDRRLSDSNLLCFIINSIAANLSTAFKIIILVLQLRYRVYILSLTKHFDVY